MFLRILLVLQCGGGFIVASQPVEFAIVIPSYNNERWCLDNVRSCTTQTYPHWKLYYIDDASRDATASLVEQYVKTHNLQDKCTVIRNTKRKRALENLYTAITTIDPHVVVAIVDGDDFLADDHVLETLAAVYQDPNVWLTYGDFRSTCSAWGSNCEEIPDDVARRNGFREYRWVASHLRTFYAALFHRIQKKDFLYNGRFFPMTYDMAIMMPMLEMASKGHFRFIRKVLYTYNVGNPINDHAVSAPLQRELDRHIRTLPKYAPLDRLFDSVPHCVSKEVL